MMKQLNLFEPVAANGESKQAAMSIKKGDVGAAMQQKDDARVESAQEKKISQKKSACATHWKLFVDGAARNNPGPAGAGFYVLKDSAFFAKKGYFLGSRTNNQAEYLALLLGLSFLKEHVKSGDCVHIISDSQLLVRQLQGEYKIKAPELKPLYTLAHALMRIIHAEIFHVLRTDNVQADRMANKGIDTKRDVPEDFITILHAHGISW